MNLFGETMTCDEFDSSRGHSKPGNGIMTRRSTIRGRPPPNLIESEIDEEWSTPLAKISRLYYDHESWSYAREILEVPSAACRKFGDEARGIASRHVIDRLSEKNYLDKIKNVGPRLRSAVELLSKPDADYLFPPVQFVVNELRAKYPEVYDSVVNKIGIKIPQDIKPKTVVVTIAKYVFETPTGEIEINWGKFISLLGLCGALAVDSVEAGYTEGVTEVVDTFGLIIEQVMGEWILADGGGWEGFIQRNQYQPILSPIPRTIVIVLVISLFFYILGTIFTYFTYDYFFYDPSMEFLKRWKLSAYSLSPIGICPKDFDFHGPFTCPNPRNPVEYLLLSCFFA